ncbi:hypothetical protein DY048_07700 [Apilactobacillus timberlakei]|uniref:Uncharacterized protein n=1 Tax=Apilactobacillus timberlakei TaxID=2008380 RepID=A0ABY2YR63_9LACO|nr:hypothetical protein DY048_07700 [Apilactobacillus timberlakei]TPR12966.1 hypothetical protein DY052_08620 [Apilactobacillus timberlakei]
MKIIKSITSKLRRYTKHFNREHPDDKPFCSDSCSPYSHNIYQEGMLYAFQKCIDEHKFSKAKYCLREVELCCNDIESAICSDIFSKEFKQELKN